MLWVASRSPCRQSTMWPERLPGSANLRRDAHKRRPPTLPAVGATLVVARFAHRVPVTGLVRASCPDLLGFSSSAGSGATTRVALHRGGLRRLNRGLRQPRKLFGGRQPRRLLDALESLLLLAFVENELIAPGRDFAELAHHCAGSGRDQPPDDDVLLKAVQRIDLAVDRRLGENPGGLLERR